MEWFTSFQANLYFLLNSAAVQISLLNECDFVKCQSTFDVKVQNLLAVSLNSSTIPQNSCKPALSKLSTDSGNVPLLAHEC